MPQHDDAIRKLKERIAANKRRYLDDEDLKKERGSQDRNFFQRKRNDVDDDIRSLQKKERSETKAKRQPIVDELEKEGKVFDFRQDSEQQKFLRSNLENNRRIAELRKEFDVASLQTQEQNIGIVSDVMKDVDETFQKSFAQINQDLLNELREFPVTAPLVEAIEKLADNNITIGDRTDEQRKTFLENKIKENKENNISVPYYEQELEKVTSKVDKPVYRKVGEDLMSVVQLGIGLIPKVMMLNLASEPAMKLGGDLGNEIGGSTGKDIGEVLGHLGLASTLGLPILIGTMVSMGASEVADKLVDGSKLDAADKKLIVQGAGHIGFLAGMFGAKPLKAGAKKLFEKNYHKFYESYNGYAPGDLFFKGGKTKLTPEGIEHFKLRAKDPSASPAEKELAINLLKKNGVTDIKAPTTIPIERGLKIGKKPPVEKKVTKKPAITVEKGIKQREEQTKFERTETKLGRDLQKSVERKRGEEVPEIFQRPRKLKAGKETKLLVKGSRKIEDLQKPVITPPPKVEPEPKKVILPEEKKLTKKGEQEVSPNIIKQRSFTTDEGKFSVYDVKKDPRDRANMFTVFESKDGWVVRNVVIPDKLKRKKIATEMYKKLNELSIKQTGNPLRSSPLRVLSTGEKVIELSPDAVKLWDSFVKSGIAEKISDKLYKFKSPPGKAKKKKTQVKGSKKQRVVDTPLTDIIVSPERFQGRDEPFSQETFKRIVTGKIQQALNEGEITQKRVDPIIKDANKYLQKNNPGAEPITIDDITPENIFDWAEFGQVQLWKDPNAFGRDLNKLTVLSGHSRLAAADFLQEHFDEFKEIPTTIRKDLSFEEAEKVAKQSNILGTKEKITSNAERFRKMREKGVKSKDVVKAAKAFHGREASRIINLSFLNRSGKTIDALKATPDDRVALQAADWIGQMRKQFDELSDSHEDEMFNWLIHDNALGTKVRSKIQFLEAVDKRVSNISFEPDKPLNLKNATVRSRLLDEYEQDVADLTKDFEDAKKELFDLRAKTLQRGVEDISKDEKVIFEQGIVDRLQKQLIDLKSKKADVLEQDTRQVDMFSDLPDSEISLSASGKLPKELTGSEMVEWIVDNNLKDSSGLLDYNDAREIAGANDLWELKEIDLDEFSFLQEPRPQGQSINPPIIRTYPDGEMEVLDGRNRIGVARSKGQKEMMAYVGRDLPEVLSVVPEAFGRQGASQLVKLKDYKLHLQLSIDQIKIIQDRGLDAEGAYYHKYNISPTKHIMKIEKEMAGIQKQIDKIEEKKNDPQINLFKTTDDEQTSMFSIEVNAEANDLIGVHNMTEDNLMFADKMGGFAMPSMAIVKAQVGFEKYGSISMVAKKNLLDPEYTKIYSRDIYSPTYPQIYNNIDKKVLFNKMKEVNDVVGQELSDANNHEHYRISQEIEKGRHNITDYTSYRLLKYYYLAKTNQLPKFILKNEPLLSSELPEFAGQYKVTKEIIGDFPLLSGKKLFEPDHKIQVKADELFKEYKEKGFYAHLDEAAKKKIALQVASEVKRDEFNKLVSEEAKKFRRAYVNKYFETLDPELRKIMIEEKIWKKEAFFDTYKLQKDIQKLLNKKRIINEYKYEDRVDKVINKQKKKYEDFLIDDFAAVFGTEYLLKGRKKVSHTLDNAVDIMGNRLIGSEDTLVQGLGKSATKSAKLFSSFKAIQKAKDKLVTLSDFDVAEKHLSDAFNEMSNRVVDHHKDKGVGFGFDRLDDLSSAVGDIAKNKNMTDLVVARILSRNGYSEVPEWRYDEIRDVALLMREMPTQYFEAKKDRVVRIGEFAGAIIPSVTNPRFTTTTTEDLIELLRKRGIEKIVTYDSDVEGDRQKAMNQFTDEMFAVEGESSIRRIVEHTGLKYEGIQKTRNHGDYVVWTDPGNGPTHYLPIDELTIDKLVEEKIRYGGFDKAETEKLRLNIENDDMLHPVPEHIKHFMSYKNDNPNMDNVGLDYVDDIETMFITKEEWLDRYGYNAIEENFYQLRKGDEGYEQNKKLFRAKKRASYEDLGTSGRIRIFRNATMADVAEEFVHHGQTEVKRGHPKLQQSIQKWEEGIRKIAKKHGVTIPQKHETFAKAYMAYLGWDEPIAEWFKLPTEIIEPFNEIMSASKTGEDNFPRLIKTSTRSLLNLPELEPVGTEMLSAKKFETTPLQTDTPEFKKWFKNSKVIDKDGKPLIVYHGSNQKFSVVKMKKGAQGLFWFTSDLESITSGTSGATGINVIMDMYAMIKKPAGWDEYDKLGLQQLQDQGYDGAILPDPDGSIVGFIFEPGQVKSASRNKGEFDPDNPSIFMSAREGREGQERPRLENYIRKVLDDLPAKMDPNRLKRLNDLEAMGDLTPELKVERRDLRKEKKGFAALDPLLRKRMSTIIRQRVKAIETGYRIGSQERENQLFDMKKDVNSYARLFLPKGNFLKSEVTGLMSAVLKAKDLKTLEAAFKKIQVVEERVRRRRIFEDYSKLLKSSSLEKGDPQFVTWIKQINKMTPQQVDAEIETVLNDTAGKGEDFSERQDEYFYLLNRYSDIKNKSTDDLEQLYLELSAEMEAGRSKRKDWLNQEKVRRQEMRDKAVAVITGGKGVLDTDEARLIGLDKEVKSAGDILSNLGTMSHSWEMILDKLSKRDPSNIFRSWLNEKFAVDVHIARTNEGAGVRKAMDTVRAKLMEIFGTENKRKLISEMDDNSLRRTTGATRIKITEFDEAGVPSKTEKIELTLSQNEAAHLLMAYEDPKLFKTFERMGIGLETIESLRKFVKPTVMKWAKWQLEEFYPRYYPDINKVYQQIRGVELPFNDKYMPIRREVSASITDQEFLGDVTEFVSMIGGSLLARIANTRPLKILDIDRVLLEHIITMEHFKAFAPVMQDMRAVFNSFQVRQAITQYHGALMLKIINRFMNDFARGGVDRKNSIEILDRIRANFIRSVIGVNPVVTIKQLTSFPAFAMDIPVKDFMIGIAQFAGNPIPKIRFLLQNSEMLKTRYHKGWERDIILAMNRARKTTSKELARKFTFTDAAMMFTKFGDGAAILFGGWGVYNYWNKKLIKQGVPKQQAHQRAMLEFEMSAKRAQQAGDVEDLGELQRQGSWQKMFTIFMTAPKQYFSNASAAYRNILYKRGSFSNNMKRLAIAHFLLPMLFQFSADGFRWDKDHMLRAALLGSLNGILILGDVMEFLFSAFQGDLFWEFDETPIGSIVGDNKVAINKIRKFVENNQFYFDEFLETADAIADATSKPFGIPYQPVKKLVKGIQDFSDAPDEVSFLRLFGYSKSLFEDEPDVDPMVTEIQNDEKRLKKLKSHAREMPTIKELVDEAKEFERVLNLKKKNSPEWKKFLDALTEERKEKRKNDPFKKPRKQRSNFKLAPGKPKL